MNTVEQIDQELNQKKEFVRRAVEAYTILGEEADGEIGKIVDEFATTFKMNRDEAGHELLARVKMVQQESQPVPETKPTVKTIDPVAKHQGILASLPKGLAQLAENGNLMVRLFKKAGTHHTSVVVTYVGGAKRTFRALKAEPENWTEVLPEPKKDEGTPAVGPVAESTLQS